ncbi:PREDICTED: probable polygalacturonase At3g15720 isoform X2 [Tarenaya hassleriana]|uniref:probable polygalacturonase At3g15720 isoform X1 n=1 Tax=Tarenaya hassleriana TaxID=28532 RepID=UPI00053C7529|nr:PREDICTED: probable polygalacturonase At3g15720 isoform X1 [Tarenaya hassleriana]XP_010548544.1 PREDICTED: probable polygalacturonase At3g15720 isoform X2 [Tarenaya hassleriana]
MELTIAFIIICVGVLGFGNVEGNIYVTSFGARGDGKTDDSQAFLKAWEAACQAGGTKTLTVPGGKNFFLQPLIFSGPCKSTVTFELLGTLLIPNPSEWKPNKNNRWIGFKDIEALTVLGPGQIDGRGEAWWNYRTPADRPTSLHFNRCNNLQVREITSVNTPRNHISIHNCTGPTISNLNLFAPGESPNTDGIDVSLSSQITIKDSSIRTGDDCVAINGGVVGINITNVNCGPGHGISVGSLGRNGQTEIVEQVLVKHCTFNKTQNGARIKTIPGGKGYVKGVVYEDITLIEAGNPIMIDQYYGCKDRCSSGASAVEISNVRFVGIKGTSVKKNAISMLCSDTKKCNDVGLEDVNITAAGEIKEVQSVCSNIEGYSRETTPPVPCFP